MPLSGPYPCPNLNVCSMICVSISDPVQIAPALQSGAGIIELRFDLIRVHPDKIYPLVPHGTRTVATCRPGEYPEEQRVKMLISAIELGASYVDLELESTVDFTKPLMEAAESNGCDVIFSHHDFRATPSARELQLLLESCYKRGGAVGKIATQVLNQADVLNLISLFKLPGRKVVLGMGKKGRITRVAGPYLGGEFTFASPGDGEETAPGQLSLAQLQMIYKTIGQ